MAHFGLWDEPRAAMDASGRGFLQNKSVTGEALVEILRAGCYCLIQNAEELNRINVFPIPDGDTGSNMAIAAKGILKRCKICQRALHAACRV